MELMIRPKAKIQIQSYPKELRYNQTEEWVQK